eukprot:GILJ01015999.1.p1 GENE.GILJ01015999.1~~GILJ01015999.1.p1  ORF type:complete len:861 (-),score=121.53 GILJ01015999.1:159-2741(-)
MLQNNGSLIGAPQMLSAASAGMGSFYRINPNLLLSGSVNAADIAMAAGIPGGLILSPDGGDVPQGQAPQQQGGMNYGGGGARPPPSMSANGKAGVLKKARHQLFYFFSPNTKAGKKVTADLAGLYTLAAHRRWLRGCMAAITLFSIVIGLANMLTDSINDVLYATNSFVCICGLACVIKLYSVKATLAGLANPLYEGRSSLLHSPYFAQMLFELALWIHTPPFVVEHIGVHMSVLDYLSFFRLYHCVLYLKEVAFGHRMFVRVLSVVGRIPIDTSYFLRTAMVYEKTKISVSIIGMAWVAISLAFHQAEARSMGDSFYFVFVTAGTIGYGDIAPVTFIGKIIAFVAWVFGLMLIGWVVSLFQVALNLTEAERNLYLMSRASKLSRQVQQEAATTIQMGWRFYKMYRHTRVVNGEPALTREASAASSAVKEDGTSNMNVSQILGTGGREVVTSNAGQRRRLQLSYQAWMLTLQCRKFKKIQHDLRQDVIIIEKQLNIHENPWGHGGGYESFAGQYPDFTGLTGSFGGRFANLGAMGYSSYNTSMGYSANANVGGFKHQPIPIVHSGEDMRKRTLSDLSIVNTPEQGPLSPNTTRDPIVSREGGAGSVIVSREGAKQQRLKQEDTQRRPARISPKSLDNTVNSLNGGGDSRSSPTPGMGGKQISSPKQTLAANPNNSTSQTPDSVANRKLYGELKKFTTVLTQVAEQQSVLLMTIQELKSDVKRVQEDQERMRRNPMRHLFLEGNRSSTPPPPPARSRAYSTTSAASPTGTNTPGNNSLLFRPTSYEGGSSFGPRDALASTVMGQEELPSVLRDSASGAEFGASFPPGAGGSTRANSDDISPPGSHNSDLPDPLSLTRRHSM